MENSVLITTLTIILPLVGAAIGYFVKQKIEEKKQLLSEVHKERRELYQRYVDLIVDILNNTKRGNKINEPEYVGKIFDFYKKYILYASPDVINAFSDYFQYLYHLNDTQELMSQKAHFSKLSLILYQMRKDLGLSNKNLGTNGERLFRAILVDFDSIMNQ